MSAPVPWREDNVRIDFKIAPTWTLMGRFTNDDWSQPYPSTLGYWGDDIYPTIEGSWKQPGRQATIKLTKLLGNTAVNDLQLSYAMNRIVVTQSGTGLAANAIPTTNNLTGASGALTPLELQQLINVDSPPFFPASSKFGGAQGLGQPGFWSSIDGTQNIQGCPPSICEGLGNMGPWHNDEQLLIFKDDFSKVFGAHTFKVLQQHNQCG